MLYRFGKAETGINEAIQHRFQAGSKHGFRSFRLFFGFRIEINRNKTIHPPIRQPGHSGDTNLRDNPDSGRHGRPEIQAPMQHPAHTESHRAGADAAGIR